MDVQGCRLPALKTPQTLPCSSQAPLRPRQTFPVAITILSAMISLSLSLYRTTPNRGVGGTRALAHSININVAMSIAVNWSFLTPHHPARLPHLHPGTATKVPTGIVALHCRLASLHSRQMGWGTLWIMANLRYYPLVI